MIRISFIDFKNMQSFHTHSAFFIHILLPGCFITFASFIWQLTSNVPPYLYVNIKNVKHKYKSVQQLETRTKESEPHWRRSKWVRTHNPKWVWLLNPYFLKFLNCCDQIVLFFFVTHFKIIFSWKFPHHKLCSILQQA